MDAQSNRRTTRLAKINFFWVRLILSACSSWEGALPRDNNETKLMELEEK